MMVRFSIFLSLAAAAQLTGATIEGRVTNGVTGEPVTGAKVQLFDGRSHRFETAADQNGVYRLTGLADGEYRGEFTKDGFADSRQTGTLAGLIGRTSFVRVSGDVPGRLDAQLEPWGALRGRVVDEDGNPAAGVRVEISRNLDNTTTTDDRGQFVFQELPPGTYTVVAKPKADTRVRDDQQVGRVAVYYPSTTRLAEASAIPVSWGADVAGIEIRLKTVPVHSVKGAVLDQGGKPVARALVTLLGPSPAGRRGLLFGISGPGPAAALVVPFASLGGFVGPGPETEVASMESRDDGTFEFEAVEKGEWRVSADTYVDGKPRSGVTTAIVAYKDVERVQIRISTPFSVEVTADWGDKQPPKGKDGGPTPTGYLVHLAPEEGQPQLDFDAAGSVTSVNGAFPGRYRVTRWQGPQGIYADAVMFGGANVLGQTVELTAGVGPLYVIVRHDAGSLRGAVENGKGAGAYLVSRSGGPVVQYTSVPCGAGGTFEFKDVVPGDYYLVAFDQWAQLPAVDLPDSIIPMAAAVRIEPNSAAASVNLRLNKWPW